MIAVEGRGGGQSASASQRIRPPKPDADVSLNKPLRVLVLPSTFVAHLIFFISLLLLHLWATSWYLE